MWLSGENWCTKAWPMTFFGLHCPRRVFRQRKPQLSRGFLAPKVPLIDEVILPYLSILSSYRLPLPTDTLPTRPSHIRYLPTTTLTLATRQKGNFDEVHTECASSIAVLPYLGIFGYGYRCPPDVLRALSCLPTLPLRPL